MINPFYASLTLGTILSARKKEIFNIKRLESISSFGFKKFFVRNCQKWLKNSTKHIDSVIFYKNWDKNYPKLTCSGIFLKTETKNKFILEVKRCSSLHKLFIIVFFCPGFIQCRTNHDGGVMSSILPQTIPPSRGG